MSIPSPFLSLNYPCDEALAWLKGRLTNANLRVVQTFDLQTARLALEGCSCPHHGTNQCDCRMFVLLVYSDSAEPATLILHGNDGQTWLSIIDHPGQRADKKTVIAIQQAVEIQASAGI